MDRKIQYCQDVSSSQIDLQIQCNPNQNPRKLFCRYQKTDSKGYIKRQNTQNSQHNIEREEQNQRTDTIQLQDLKLQKARQCGIGENIQIDQWNRIENP